MSENFGKRKKSILFYVSFVVVFILKIHLYVLVSLVIFYERLPKICVIKLQFNKYYDFIHFEYIVTCFLSCIYFENIVICFVFLVLIL